MLLQDNKQYSDDSLFFYLVRILGHSENTSTQGLAADLLEALMQDLPRRLVKGLHVVPDEWETLAQLKEPLNIDGLLQLIIATASIKVIGMHLPITTGIVHHTCNAAVQSHSMTAAHACNHTSIVLCKISPSGSRLCLLEVWV